MVCDLCKKNQANVHLKQICNGESRELYVCAECAALQGFDVHAPLATADFLFGVGLGGDAKAAGDAEDRPCPGCHLRGSDFRQTSRLGCPRCYEAFAAELAPMLEAMHKGLQHVGKVPASAAAGTEAAMLREALAAAVAEQRFEDAAGLRDRIRALAAAGTAALPAGTQAKT